MFYGDVECFDPRRFNFIIENGLPDDSLKRICKCLKFSEEYKEKFRKKLISFAEISPHIKEDSFEVVYAPNVPNEFESAQLFECSESEGGEAEEDEHTSP